MLTSQKALHMAQSASGCRTSRSGPNKNRVSGSCVHDSASCLPSQLLIVHPLFLVDSAWPAHITVKTDVQLESRSVPESLD